MTGILHEQAQSGRALDEYLVLATQKGDQAALDRLVRRWHGRLVAHAWRLTGEREWADEIVQGAWIEIIRGLPRLRSERAFPAWVYRIVTRGAARRIGRAVTDRNAADAMQIESEDAEIAPSFPHHDFRKALEHLSPAQRAAVALHYFEDLSIAEVAIALDAPTGTIKTRLMHARRRLRAHFEGDDNGQD